jgi:ribosomal protein S6--L-glutamate ligase
MKKIGVIGIPGGWSSEAVADALEKRTGFRLLVEMDHVRYNSEQNTCFYKEMDLLNLDGLIIKKIGARYSPDHLQRLDLLRLLASRGLRIFSDPFAVSRCLDRLSCTLTLRLGGIPMPPTSMTEDIEMAEAVVRHFGQAVFKPLFTSKARGMKILDGSDPFLKNKIMEFKKLGNSVMYIQKKIPIPGRDLGIAFLRGEFIGAYARVTNGDSWNTTTANGGTYQAVEPAVDVIDLARRSQSLFHLDFTCVDVVESDTGPMVFEVSALGGFRGLQEAQGIDMAEMIVDHVLERLAHERS